MSPTRLGQLALLPALAEAADLDVPPVIEEALARGAALAISISGGKDSEAMLTALAAEHRRRSWPGRIYAIHAHLGRAEWPQTLEHCHAICEREGIELVVVERPQGDLVDEIRARMEKLRGTGKPHWPSAASRYCTSDQKRTQIDKVLRSPWPTATQRFCTADQKRDQIIKQHRGHDLVIAAMGMRAQESTARGRKPVVSVASRVTAAALAGMSPGDALRAQRQGQRLGLDWLPIHHWREEDVWAVIGTSTEDLERRRELYRAGDESQALDGWPAHPAYVFGNQRLSCALCILASRNDLINGARHNPELYREYIEIERESGFKFRFDLALSDLLPVVRQAHD